MRVDHYYYIMSYMVYFCTIISVWCPSMIRFHIPYLFWFLHESHLDYSGDIINYHFNCKGHLTWNEPWLIYSVIYYSLICRYGEFYPMVYPSGWPFLSLVVVFHSTVCVYKNILSSQLAQAFNVKSPISHTIYYDRVQINISTSLSFYAMWEIFPNL